MTLGRTSSNSKKAQAVLFLCYNAFTSIPSQYALLLVSMIAMMPSLVGVYIYVKSVSFFSSPVCKCI